MHTYQTHPGLFLALEGAHGSGKTTQAKRIHDWLCNQGYSVVLTREVGGTTVGERIRALIEESDCASSLGLAPKSLLFLVLAARNLHVQQVIGPALLEGKIVICERFEGSTYAIQHGADQLEWEFVSHVHKFASDNLTPDRTILLDIFADLGIERKRRCGKSGFWEARPMDYHERIAQSYRDAAEQLQGWSVVDGTQNEARVFTDLQHIIIPMLHDKLVVSERTPVV